MSGLFVYDSHGNNKQTAAKGKLLKGASFNQSFFSQEPRKFSGLIVNDLAGKTKSSKAATCCSFLV
jgi:hypothetical protein